MQTSRLKPLIKFDIPDEKIYVDIPDKKAAEYPLEECSKLFKVSLKHGIFYNGKDEQLIDEIQSKFKDNPTNQAVVEFINNPKNYFSIHYINKICGYGLVATEDIPENTVVGIYSVELVVRPDDEKELLTRDERAYDMNGADNVFINGKKYDFIFRPLKQGDCTRFAPHLPSKDDIDQLSLESNIPKESILTANVNFPRTYIEGKPVRYYVTTRAIKKGEMIGIDYGPTYWSNRGNPSLFVQMQNQIRVANYNKDQARYELSNETINLLPQRKRKRMDSEEEFSQNKKIKIVDGFGEREPVQFSFFNRSLRSHSNDKPLFRRKIGSSR